MSTVHEERQRGIRVMNRDGHIAGLRSCSELELSAAEKKQFLAINKAATKVKRFLKRKHSVLNVCVMFIAYGSKRQRDTAQAQMYAMAGQAMGNSTPQDSQQYATAIQVYERMRRFASEVAAPKVKSILYLEFMACELFFCPKTCIVGPKFFHHAQLVIFFGPPVT